MPAPAATTRPPWDDLVPMFQSMRAKLLAAAPPGMVAALDQASASWRGGFARHGLDVDNEWHLYAVINGIGFTLEAAEQTAQRLNPRAVPQFMSLTALSVASLMLHLLAYVPEDIRAKVREG